MPDGTAAAVDQATRLGEIGFPEFTTKLVTDVFDALISANLRQMEAYSELVRATGKTLQEYINETRDEISGEEIMKWIGGIAPQLLEPRDGKVELAGAEIDEGEANALNRALAIPGEAPVTVFAEGTIAETAVANILDAVAHRISADRFSFLTQMVKMGVLRLVVENGIIETRLTFNTSGTSVSESATSSFRRSDFKVRASASTGTLLSRWVRASASTAYSNVSVSTANASQRDVSGSQVQIFGRVQINFKTDYAPLADQ